MSKLIAKFKQKARRLKSLMVKYRRLLLIIFFIGLFYDVFLNTRISEYFTAFIILLWCLNLLLFKIKPRKTIALGVAAYLLAFVSQFWGKEVIMEKGASWFLIFTLTALIQWLIKNLLKK